jgi:hypothetical protein
MLRFILVLRVLWDCLAQPGIEEENKGEQTNNVPIKLMRDAQDYAYHAQGEATEARAASHETRAKIAARRTQEADGKVVISHGINSGYLAPVKVETKSTDASAKVAVSWMQKTRAVVDQTDALAYAAAKASAESKVAELKAGAAAYFQELLAALRAKAGGPKNAKFAAASAAAKPYFALQMATTGVVATYFIFCNDLLGKVKAVVKQAFGIANEANLLQAQGKSELALRKMVQAHGMIVKANEEETLAKQVYKLAREINVAIPAFSQTAAVAAEHAFANSLLQEYEDSVEQEDSESSVAAQESDTLELLTSAGSGVSQPIKKKNPFAARKNKAIGSEVTQAADEAVAEALAGPPSNEQLLQLQKTGQEIEESMKSFDIENEKLAAELDKFQLKAEADTEKSLAEAQEVADFLSHKFGGAGQGKVGLHATNSIKVGDLVDKSHH